MRSISSFLGQGRNRTSGRRTRKNQSPRSTRLAARFETLEARQLLAADVLNSLAQVSSAIPAAGGVNELRLDVEGGTAVLGFRMHGIDATLDPDQMQIKTLAGISIAPVKSVADLSGGTDSLFLAELGPGSYTIYTRGEGTTHGAYSVDVFVAGDMGGDGRVSQQELLWATGAIVQKQGGWNNMTALYYGMNGIDLAGPSLYRTQCDTDLDGDVDNEDLGRIDKNSRAAQVTLTLVADMEAPLLSAGIVNDTGHSDTDGVTNELAIAGTITDENPISYFLAGMDDAPRSSYISVAAVVDASGNFTLSLADLELIADGSLANTGAHTLHLVAQDTIGNAAESHVTIPFNLDTIAPEAPTNLDLDAASDLGFSNTDNITADTTPTLNATAELDAMVTFYSSLVSNPLGSGKMGDVATATPTTPLADGDHFVTAIAEDVAGNVSVTSASLVVTIETGLPSAPTVALAAASDTGELGDKTTSLTSVTLEGTADPGALVSLSGTALSTTADAVTGAYSLAGVPLSWNENALTVVAMDLAGNTRSTTDTFKQNSLPTANAGFDPVAADEDVAPAAVSLVDLFADANLAAGDQLTLSIVSVTNPVGKDGLVSASLTNTTGQIVNSHLVLTLGANLSGQATIVVRATDSFGETIEGTVVVNVSPVNDAPTIIDTSVPQPEEDTPILIDLLPRVSDLETPGDELEFEIVVGSEEHCTAVLQADGHTVLFTPEQDFNDLASFEFKVTDKAEGDSPAKTTQLVIFVNVVEFNDPPVANPESDTIDEDGAVDFDLRELASDKETVDDNLTFTVTNGVGGTVALLPDGYTARFTATPNFNGAADFSYTVIDAGMKTASATISVTVNPINDTPVALTTAQTTNEDATVVIDLWDLVNDVETTDKANLTFSVGDPIEGTLNLVDGRYLHFTPSDNFNGTGSFTYSVTDTADGGSPAITVGPLTVNVVVNPVNDPPTTTNLPALGTLEDTSFTFDLLDYAGDLETDDADLVFAITGMSKGTAVIQADGHTVLFTPAENANGAGSLTFTVKDTGDGPQHLDPITSDPVTIAVAITAVNDTPVAQTTQQTTNEDATVVIDLWDLVNDVETTNKADLTFTVGDPVLGTINLVDGRYLHFTPSDNQNGTGSFTYSVTDTADNGSPAITVGPLTVNVVINPINDPPTTTNLPDLGTLEDTSFTFDLLNYAADLETAPADLVFEITGTSKGTAVIQADGHTVLFTPAENANGAGSLTFTVKDTGDGPQHLDPITSDPVTIAVSITAVNDAPVALTTQQTTDEDTTVVIDLWNLVNDVETTDKANLTFTVGDPVLGTINLVDGRYLHFIPSDNQNGTGSFTYTVTDKPDGDSDAITVGPLTVNVVIRPVNDPPVASGDSDEIDEDTSIDFDLRELVNDVETTDKTKLTFSVTSGVGGTVTLVDGHIARFVAAENFNGAASFTYSVTDTGDNDADAVTVGPVSIAVTVRPVNDAPVALTTQQTTNEDTTVMIDLWDLVDDVETTNKTELLFTVGDPIHGAINLVDGHLLYFTPSDNQNGTGSFTYSVTDAGDNGTAPITVGPLTVNVVINPINDQPTTVNTPDLGTLEDTSFTFDLLDYAADLETDDADLVFAITGTSNGTAVIQADGHTVLFTPAENANGAGSLTFTVTDTGDGPEHLDPITSDPVTIAVAITAVNDAPTAVDDSRMVPNNRPTTIDVIANDTDPDIGDVLTIDSFDASALQYGTLVAAGDGKSLTYTPTSAEEGTETFTYTVRDLAGLTDTITVTLTLVANTPPTADDESGATDEDTVLQGNDLLIGDTDPDEGDVLTTVPVTNLILASGAVVTIDAAGNYTYDPAGAFGHLGVGQTAEDTFEYTVDDGHGGQDTGLVTITIHGLNDAPIAVSQTGATTNEDTPLTGNVLTDAFDPDGPDTVSAVFFDGFNAAGAHIIIDAAGNFTYDPTTSSNLQALKVGASYEDNFSFTIRDSHGAESTATVTILVTGVNDAPKANDDDFTPASVAANEDSVYFKSASQGVLANDGDIESDLFEIVGFSATSAKGAVVVVQSTGAFTYNPTEASELQALHAGEFVTDTFTYTIRDIHGAESTGTVTIRVNGANDAPVAEDKTAEAVADTLYEGSGLLGNATDVDTDETAGLVIYPEASDTSSEALAAVSVNADGTYTYDPRGIAAFVALGQGVTATDTFHFVVVDIHNAQGVGTVTVTVTGVNDAPTAVNDAFSTGENTPLSADASRNLLTGPTGDTDPDSNDELHAEAAVKTSAKGAAVTIYADGTFSYDPGAIFNALGVDHTDTDTFTYTVVDSYGVTSVGTVTITINGENDAPTPTADTITPAISKIDEIDIDVLANDTDPDTGDTLTVSSFNGLSAQGATITLNGDGTLHYNPKTSTTLAALGAGESLPDTFNYTAWDGKGGFTQSSVTLTVAGQSNAPYVLNEIADMWLTDSSSPQPGDIDLSNVFHDMEGDALTYVATTSNDKLVTAEIVNGHFLRVRYVTYTSGQNRTPATITVTATESTPQQLQATDQFVVTVSPEELINVKLVVLDSPSTTGTAATPPTSVDEVTVGSQYVVEIWIQDAYDASVTNGPSIGLIGAWFDVAYNTAIADAGVLGYSSPFSAGTFKSGTVNDTAGVVSEFGDGTIDLGVALTGYARLGYITMTASAVGVQMFNATCSEVSRFPNGGDNGEINLSQVHVEPVSVDQTQEVLNFAISGSTNFQIGGKLYGHNLTAQIDVSNLSAGESGSLQVVVDDLDNPSQLTVLGGTLDFSEYMGGTLRPGAFGGDSSAAADFAFNDIDGQNIEMALRQLTIDFNTAMLSVANKHFNGALIQMASSGYADIRQPAGGNRHTMADLPATANSYESASLLNVGGVYQLEFVFSRTIDLSSLVSSPNSYLTLSGTFVANYDPSGAGLTGEQTAVDEKSGTQVHATLSHDPTLVPAGAQVDTLPTSEAWIDEWDAFWVEVWVETDQVAGVRSARVDLAYDADYFTATTVDHGHTFVENVAGDVSRDGLVEGLGGDTSLIGFGVGGYTLLGRVRFQSLAGDNVPLDGIESLLNPFDLGLELRNLDVELIGQGDVDASIGEMPNTELWAVPYDIDDSGRVSVTDLGYFASAFKQEVLDSSLAYVWGCDFDRTGRVGLADLGYFAANYGKSKTGDADIVFPDSFLQRWVGAGLDVEGDATVGQVLDAAVNLWQDELALDQPMAIQLVVKDLGGSRLAEAQILKVNAVGIPTVGRITLDDDAAGLGWSTQLDTLGDAGRYDLYTVLLHEVGHTLGFMDGYEGFNTYVKTNTDCVKQFVTEDISVPLDAAGEHLAGDDLAADLMSATLAPGVRKLPSELDVQMLEAAYQAALNGATGFSNLTAAMTADAMTTVRSTADLAALTRLDGDMTWARLLGGEFGLPNMTDDRTESLVAPRRDLVDALYTTQRIGRDEDERPSAPRIDGLFANEWSDDSLLTDLAGDSDVRADDAQSVDEALAGWDELIA